MLTAGRALSKRFFLASRWWNLNHCQAVVKQSGNKPEQWSSNVAAILAVAGSAVGLGNFLRFPGLVAEYGGGAFMVAYVISFLVIGLPISWAEWAAGRYGGARGFHSSPGIMNLLWKSPLAKYVGVLGVVVPVGIYMYYIYIEAWCLGYAVNFLVGDMHFDSVEASAAWWAGFVGLEEDGGALRTVSLSGVLPYVLFVFVLNFYIIYRGVSKGIEKFTHYAMPLLLVLGIIMLVRVLTLGTPDASRPEANINNGLGFLWNPTKTFLVTTDAQTGAVLERTEIVGKRAIASAQGQIAAEATAQQGAAQQQASALATGAPQQAGSAQTQLAKTAAADFPADRQGAAGQTVTHLETLGIVTQLKNPNLWLAAAGQIFFSLSIGLGIIITYASYLGKREDVALSALTACGANQMTEVGMGGLITVPAAVAFIGVAGLTGAGLSTFDLGFKVLPMVLTQMPGGAFFGFLWFFLLFLAAIMSSVSVLQPGLAFVEEALKTDRKRSVALLGLLTGVGAALVVYFSRDAKALDTLDFWTGIFLAFTLGTLQSMIYAWGFGARRIFDELRSGALLRVPVFLIFMLRWITPLFLLSIFSIWVWGNFFGSSMSPYVADLIGGEGRGPSPVAWLSVSIIIMLFIFFSVVTASVRRYRQAQQDLCAPHRTP